jgi:hypothetical protein
MFRGEPDCPKTVDDLYDADANARCANRILATQVRYRLTSYRIHITHWTIFRDSTRGKPGVRAIAVTGPDVPFKNFQCS